MRARAAAVARGGCAGGQLPAAASHPVPSPRSAAGEG